MCGHVTIFEEPAHKKNLAKKKLGRKTPFCFPKRTFQKNQHTDQKTYKNWSKFYLSKKKIFCWNPCALFLKQVQVDERDCKARSDGRNERFIT